MTLQKAVFQKKNEDDCCQEKIHFQAMNLISLAVQTASVKIWCEWFYQTKVTMSTKSMGFRVHKCTRMIHFLWTISILDIFISQDQLSMINAVFFCLLKD